MGVQGTRSLGARAALGCRLTSMMEVQHAVRQQALDVRCSSAKAPEGRLGGPGHLSWSMHGMHLPKDA